MTIESGRPRGRPRKDSAPQAAPARKRDRIRAAVDQKTLGVAAVATIGALAAGAIGFLGFRRIDAGRRRADPQAKPLADEIRDRASSAASGVMERASDIASDVRDRASATVHEIGTRAGAIKDEVLERTRLGDPEPAPHADDHQTHRQSDANAA